MSSRVEIAERSVLSQSLIQGEHKLLRFSGKGKSMGE